MPDAYASMPMPDVLVVCMVQHSTTLREVVCNAAASGAALAIARYGG